MTDQVATAGSIVSPPASASPAQPDDVATTVNGSEAAVSNGDVQSADAKEAAPPLDATDDTKTTSDDVTGQEILDTKSKPASAEDGTTAEKAEKEDTDAPATTADAQDDAFGEATATPSNSKGKARRKSGVPEHKSKKLNKKASKAKMSHVDASPGDYFFIRLKGYPLWPGIVCDWEILPENIRKIRPVTAANADGVYREDFADGGKNIHDRTFPVMYLFTNEFGWIPNYDLVDMDKDNILNEITPNTRKDLVEAYHLASEKHELSHYKQLLEDHARVKAEEEEAKAAAAAEKAEAKAKKAAGGKKPKKSASTVVAEGDEDVEDVEMGEGSGDLEVDESAAPKPKASKKRKTAGDETASTPQRAESVKKPKIKLTTTPKVANGSGTTKSTTKKETKAKTPKAKKATNGETNGDAKPAPKEPELSEEEKRQKKEKEILFLRHKLQKGLLSKEQPPKEDEMKQMSEYVSKLEGYAELEVSIIRATKINKVLKAIIKLEEIPKESEYKFKERSSSLLEKWNKILDNASAPSTSAAASATESKQTNGVAKPEEDETTVQSAEEAPAAVDEDVVMEEADAKVEESIVVKSQAAEDVVTEDKLESAAATVEAEA